MHTPQFRFDSQFLFPRYSLKNTRPIFPSARLRFLGWGRNSSERRRRVVESCEKEGCFDALRGNKFCVIFGQNRVSRRVKPPFWAKLAVFGVRLRPIVAFRRKIARSDAYFGLVSQLEAVLRYM